MEVNNSLEGFTELHNHTLEWLDCFGVDSFKWRCIIVWKGLQNFITIQCLELLDVSNGDKELLEGFTELHNHTMFGIT